MMASIVTRPRRFWCLECREWTASGPLDFECSRCRSQYLCGECGFQINQTGRCLRPEHLGPCPETTEDS